MGSTLASTRSEPAAANPELENAIGILLTDPSILELEKAGAQSEFQLHLSPQDSLVDQDPFFLAAQSWSKSERSTGDDSVGFVETSQSVTLYPRGLHQALTLTAPLHPLLATDEYIYLSARDPAWLAKHGNSQGLFVVPYQKLLASSVSKSSVPVFFIPLPGEGWAGNLEVTEIPHEDLLVIRDSAGRPLPFRVGDIRQIVKIESVNLFLATAQATQNALDRLQDSPEEGAKLARSLIASLQEKNFDGKDYSASLALFSKELETTISKILGDSRLVLPKGSTAGFGLLYTGFDLEHPKNGSFIFGKPKSQVSWLRKLIDLVGPRSALALDPEVVRFLHGTGRVLTVCGTVFIGGIVARYTVLKEEINQRLRDARARGDTRAARRVPWDIFAHSMTVLAQFPAVWSAQGLRYLLDRVGVSENSGIRKLYNSTFGFSLRTSDRTPVNTKTLILGVAILGGTDVALVAFQSYFLMGWIGEGLAWLVPTLQARVHQAFFAENKEAGLYRLLNVIQNMIAYISSGAYTYARDVQTNKTAEAQRRVTDAMASEGKTPGTLQYKTEFDARVNAYVREQMARQELPGEKDFLFDANTLYSRFIAALGYESLEDAPQVVSPGSEEKVTYQGLNRPGLMKSALKQAIADAEAELAQNPASAAKQQSLELLRQVKNDLNALYEFVRHPQFFLSAGKLLSLATKFRQFQELDLRERGARRQLVSLTGNGDAANYVPASWKERFPQGAAEAARVFRSAFNAKLETKPKTGPSRVGRAVTAPFRYLDRTYENWQIRRAVTRAKEKFIERTGLLPEPYMEETPGPNPTVNKKVWDELVQAELVRASGLYPDDSDFEFLSAVEDRATQKLQQRLDSDTEFVERLKTLPPQQQNELLALQKADLFAEIYVDSAVNKELIDPSSPMQPGRFQKLRQTSLVRNSRWMTKGLRAFEGLWSNTRYQRGLGAQILRVAGPLDDIIQGNLINWRNFPVYSTIGYWWAGAVWGSNYPRMAWFISRVLFSGTTIVAGWMITQRTTANLGIKPGRSMRDMLGYSIIGSFLTMGSSFLYPMYSQDIAQKIEQIGTFCRQVFLGH